METNLTEQLKQLQQAEPSFVTPSEDEYVLTPKDEAAAVEQEIKRLREHKLWRINDREGLPSAFVVQARQNAYDQPREYWEAMIDKPALLRRINNIMLQERWYKQRREKEKQEAAEKAAAHKAFWNANQFFKFMKWNSERLGRPLITNEQTFPLIQTLCFFLSRDPRFESQLGYSFKKGLLLRGTSGLGKTHLVKCVAENELNPVKIYPVLDVMEGVKQKGEFNIAPGSTVYLDDVGTETSPVKFYGTEINWVKDFIEMYYTSGRPFPLLMLSTNLSFAEIEAKYGYRVRSRLREMVNIIEIEGDDLRQ